LAGPTVLYFQLMYKHIFILLFVITFVGKANAQTKNELAKIKKDTALYYMKNSGALAPSVDSADYALFIFPNDPADKKSLYPVAEYYMNGKRKLTGATHSQLYLLTLEGSVMSFSPNGKRQRIMTYNNGVPEGDIIDYYPNGQIYSLTKYVVNASVANGHVNMQRVLSLVECHDSTGKVLAEKGNGHWLKFNEGFKALYEEGPVSNGVEDGEWMIYLEDKKIAFTFTKGIVTKPIDYNFTGKVFTIVDTQPEFKDGANGMNRFLAQNIRYPAIDREKNIQGKVIMSFIVELDRTFSNLKVTKSPSATMTDEVMRVFKLWPPWKPGLIAGVPVRTQYIMPVNFTLASD